MKKDNLLFRFIRDFLIEYLPNQKFCSPNTVQAYKTSLALFLEFVKTEKKLPLYQITFETITQSVLANFLNWLENERGCSIRTRNHRLACIRSFYKYAGGMDLTVTSHQHEILKVPLKKEDKVITVPYLSEKALTTVLLQPNTSTKKGFRDLFYMILMYDTGARNSEILHLKVHDVHPDENKPYIIVTGKGNKTRVIPIMPKTVEYFHKYISLFHEDVSVNNHLFYVVKNNHKQEMSPDNVARFMKIYGESAKAICPEMPNKLHPHIFRHTRAMHLYREGMPLVLISEWLGHSHIETTMVYANADTEMKRKAIEKATKPHNPLNAERNIKIVYDDKTIKKLYGLL
jgi:site-specific recombinase XerD